MAPNRNKRSKAGRESKLILSSGRKSKPRLKSEDKHPATPTRSTTTTTARNKGKQLKGTLKDRLKYGRKSQSGAGEGETTRTKSLKNRNNSLKTPSNSRPRSNVRPKSKPRCTLQSGSNSHRPQSQKQRDSVKNKMKNLDIARAMDIDLSEERIQGGSPGIRCRSRIPMSGTLDLDLALGLTLELGHSSSRDNDVRRTYDTEGEQSRDGASSLVERELRRIRDCWTPINQVQSQGRARSSRRSKVNYKLLSGARNKTDEGLDVLYIGTQRPKIAVQDVNSTKPKPKVPENAKHYEDKSRSSSLRSSLKHPNDDQVNRSAYLVPLKSDKEGAERDPETDPTVSSAESQVEDDLKMDIRSTYPSSKHGSIIQAKRPHTDQAPDHGNMALDVPSTGMGPCMALDIPSTGMGPCMALDVPSTGMGPCSSILPRKARTILSQLLAQAHNNSMSQHLDTQSNDAAQDSDTGSDVDLRTEKLLFIDKITCVDKDSFIYSTDTCQHSNSSRGDLAAGLCSSTRKRKLDVPSSQVSKHACVLWSSEQRRHFQQVHPELSSQQLDVCMREAWQNMSGVSKARYLTGALRAVQDRNKPTAPSDPVDQSCCQEQGDTEAWFEKRSITYQHAYLHTRLKRLQLQMSAMSYSRLLTAYCEAYRHASQTADSSVSCDELGRTIMFRSLLTHTNEVHHGDSVKQAQRMLHKCVHEILTGDDGLRWQDEFSQPLGYLLEDLPDLATLSLSGNLESCSSERIQEIERYLVASASNCILGTQSGEQANNHTLSPCMISRHLEASISPVEFQIPVMYNHNLTSQFISHLPKSLPDIQLSDHLPKSLPDIQLSDHLPKSLPDIQLSDLDIPCGSVSTKLSIKQLNVVVAQTIMEQTSRLWSRDLDYEAVLTDMVVARKLEALD